jgi:hypothetical protein
VSACIGLLPLQKASTVVLEFPQDLPNTAFITLGFHDALSGESLGSVPTAKLGAATLKANFPSKLHEQ